MRHIQVRPVDQLTEVPAGNIVTLGEVRENILGELKGPRLHQPGPGLVLYRLHFIGGLDQIDSCISVEEKKLLQPSVIAVLAPKLVLYVLKHLLLLQGEGHVQLRQARWRGFLDYLGLVIVDSFHVDFVEFVEPPVPFIIRKHPGGFHARLKTFLESAELTVLLGLSVYLTVLVLFALKYLIIL